MFEELDDLSSPKLTIRDACEDKRLEKAIDLKLPGFLDEVIMDKNLYIDFCAADLKGIFSSAELLGAFRKRDSSLPDFKDAEDILILLHLKNPESSDLSLYKKRISQNCHSNFLIGVKKDTESYADFLLFRHHSLPSENILFLDIDGVLNATGDKDIMEDTFSLSRLELFNKLVKETDSEIVIISSRGRYPEERERIEKNIFSYYKILYMTDYKITKYRADAIDWYISHSLCKNYVILDDIDSGYLENEKVKDHFIEIINGFDENDYKKITELLK